MLLSLWQVWTAAILVPIVLLLIIPRRIADGWLGIAILLLPILFGVFCSWFCPDVYFISQCGTFKKKVLLLPTQVYQTKLSLGGHCYVVNGTGQTIFVNTRLYLKDVAEYGMDTDLTSAIKHQSVFQHDDSFIHLFFAEFPTSVVVDSRNTAKRLSQVSCTALKR